MPQGRARRYIHLIDLQGQASTGQTQMKNRVQLTCNIFKITTRAQGQTRVLKLDSTTGNMTEGTEATTKYSRQCTNVTCMKQWNEPVIYTMKQLH